MKALVRTAIAAAALAAPASAQPGDPVVAALLERLDAGEIVAITENAVLDPVRASEWLNEPIYRTTPELLGPEGPRPEIENQPLQPTSPGVATAPAQGAATAAPATTTAAPLETPVVAELGLEMEEIGEVTDLVVDPTTGRVVAFVVEVGGFLGLGSTEAALPVEQVAVVYDGFESWLETRVTREALQQAVEITEALESEPVSEPLAD